MKIFTGKQIHEWDTYTMEHEPIRPIDLMERAAKALTSSIISRWDKTHEVVVFAGPGNNGGDALAVARLLAQMEYQVSVYLFNINDNLSDECAKNLKRLQETRHVKKLAVITSNFDPPKLQAGMLVVDGIFGSGLNKPLQGGFAALVKFINAAPADVVSIDIPSGMLTEDNTQVNRQHIIRAKVTLTLQRKKLAMFLADNEPFLGEIEVLDINLSDEFVERTPAAVCISDEKDMQRMMLSRQSFAHKGQMGHALLFAGSYGMAGAACLAAKACLRSGVGKLTVHTPLCNNNILQISVPEAIVQHDSGDTYFIENIETDNYEAVAMGPGIGQNEETAIALVGQIRRTQCPLILDADALNILSAHRAWMEQLPQDLILTPHPGELDRLLGSTCNGNYERLQKTRELAERLGAFIILKGHYSALCTPDGEVILNPTGNAGMATAGSGDVLTGIILGLLARGYTRRNACLIGMYLHGLAGDIAAETVGQESLIASDIVKFLPEAFRNLNNNKKSSGVR